VVNRALLGQVLVPFAAMALVATAAALYLRHRAPPGNPVAGVPLRNPFSLRAAAKFAAFFALVLLVVKLVQTYAPGHGVYFVAALAGTTDVDAITLSMAQYARTGSSQIAVQAITVAALTNTVVKTVMVSVLADAGLRRPVLAAATLVLVAGALSLAVL
jgi:uncharacterized membrane protein (DUF4010 family)